MHWSLASEHFQFQDRSFAATLDEFVTYCAFIKRGPAWLKILSLSVNPNCVYQGDLTRVRCPERVWLFVGIWYFSKTCACLRLTKDPCRESISGKTTLLLCIGIYQHTQGSLKQYSIGKIMRENYLKSEILENGENYNLCWIASWFQLFRQVK